MTVRYDDVISEIAAYVCHDREVGSDEAYRTARLALMDSIGWPFLAMGFPACRDFIAIQDATTNLTHGVPVPGTINRRSPEQAAFDITTSIRWLDLNDTWLAKEWGHPSDNFGAILAAVYNSARLRRDCAIQMRDVFELAIRAYEIQGVSGARQRVQSCRHRPCVARQGCIGGSRCGYCFRKKTRKSLLLPYLHAWLDATLRA